DGHYRHEIMPSSPLTGEANLLVLPNIDAANISYNLLKNAAGGGIAIGPVLLGAAGVVVVVDEHRQPAAVEEHVPARRQPFAVVGRAAHAAGERAVVRSEEN